MWGFVVNVRNSDLRESRGAEGEARIPANMSWTEPLARQLGGYAPMRLCNRCPAATPASKADSGF
jgi:hypothetical protein